MNSFVLLNRKILQWEWYDDANVFRLFVHLIIKANHKDKKWRGHFIKRGQLITSTNNLSQELGISFKATRIALDKLKSTNEIIVEGARSHSLITLVKYDTYQGYEAYRGKPGANEGQTKGIQGANEGQQLNNDNNDNNDNKTIINRAAEENLKLLFKNDKYIGAMTKKFSITVDELRTLYEEFNEHLALRNDGFRTESDYTAYFLNWYTKRYNKDKRTGETKQSSIFKQTY